MNTKTVNRHKKEPMSQINVTPLVDVMLVLLIIFMVTAPMMQAGINVNLPKVRAGAVAAKKEPLIVTIDRHGKIYIGKSRIRSGVLRRKMRAILKNRQDAMVLLRADAHVPYGYVIKAMAEMRRAGINRVGMVTEPIDRGKR